MSTYFEIMDLDEEAANLPSPPVVINDMDLDFSTEEGRAELVQYLTSVFDGDTISPIPSCLCGHLTGESRVGRKCDNCGTRVLNLVDRPADATYWIAPPEGVTAFIHPEAWTVLNSRMVHAKRFSVLEWICDPHYSERYPELQHELDAYLRVHKKGINYFVANFDAVMDYLLSSKLVRLAAAQRSDYVAFIEQNKHKFFPRMLPIMSRLFIVSENTPMGMYADEKTREIPDAVYAVTSTISLKMPLSRRQSQAVKCVSKLARNLNLTYTRFIGSKWGLIRRQYIGSRLDWTACGVITSLSEVHEYDELHVPWAMACQLLRYHIMAKLMRQDGMTPNEAIQFLEDHTVVWHPRLRAIFDELIAETWDGEGIHVILQRNPSLTRGSAQCLRITVIKDDLSDNTISLSVLILGPFNADFDGDALNMLLILDKRMLEWMKRLKPHLNARDLRRPRRLSGFLKLPAPTSAIMMNYLHEEDDRPVGTFECVQVEPSYEFRTSSYDEYMEDLVKDLDLEWATELGE